MAKFEVINVLGNKVSDLEINDKVFAIEPHNQAMFDLVMAERASLRQGTHSTKTRSEVSGGGRKPWRQKGTGRARQGSIRSPQWRGGGVVFGPTPKKNYKLKINKKVKKLALKSGWSVKAKEAALIFVDNIQFKKPSSKDFNTFLKNIEAADKKVLFLLEADEKLYNTYLSGRNFQNVLPITATEVMLDDILNSDKIVLTESVVRKIEEVLK